MFALFTENENSAQPPERDSDPSGDGSPERSPAPRGDSGDQPTLVSDDAEAYEDQQTGVAVSYVLKEQEIFQCLKRAGFSGSRGVRILAGSALLAVAAVVCLVQGIRTGNSSLYDWAACCFVLAAAFLLWPLRNLRTIAKNGAEAGKIHLKIYPDHIEAQNSAKQIEIPLDGTSERVRLQNTIALFLPHQEKTDGKTPHLLILPLRCIDETVLPDVEAMLLAGTRPKKLRGFFSEREA